MSVTDELAGMTEIALFAGGGGGVLGSKMLGIRTVAYVEWDAYPQAVLKARMADGLIETAPVFGDVREFDTSPYAGKVDVVSGGFPCQPFSTAGRREADFDPRNMWPATRDIIRGVRPKYAYLENVAGLLTGTHGYFGVVIGELARSGYDVAWTCLPAAAVGAPHRRDRMWILGRRRDVESTGTVPLAEFARFDEESLSWRSGPGRCRGDTASTVTASVPWPRSGFVRTGTDGSVVVYALDPVSQADGTTRDGWPWPRILEDLRIPDPLAGARPAAPDAPGVEMLPTPNAFDAHAVGASRLERKGRHAVSLHHLAADWSGHEGRTYPTPLAGNATPGEGGNHGGMALRAAAVEADLEHGRTWATLTVQGLNGGSVGQLNPDWVEWLMGWPVGWTSMSPMTDAEAQAYAADMPGPWWRREPPHVPRITVGTPDRAARLKACGNGQVPLCNAAAFEVLLETYRQIGVACAHVPDEELDAFDLLGL